MTSSGGEALSSEASADVPLEAVGKVEEAAVVEVEKTLASVDGVGKQRLQTNGDPPNGREASSSGPGGEVISEETLAHAAELFEKGSKAIEDGDFVDAVDCLSRALEIRVAHYGELAAECAISYYKYGCALLCKAQEEADPLVDVPQNTPRITEKDKTLTSVEDSGSSKASVNDTNQDASNNKEAEEVCSESSDKDEEDDNEGSDGDGEGLGEADEDESDLDQAWKMLELARTIVEKRPEDTMEKVNILAALGEVSAEREDMETSLNDYLRALSILERLVEPDNRRMVELNFRVCLVLEMESKIEEAIPYCEKAISVCKSLLQRLKEDSPNLIDLAEDGVDPAAESDKSGNKSCLVSGSDPSISVGSETGVLSGILSELERKLEELQQMLSNPNLNPLISEVMKMIASASSKSTTATKAALCSSGEVGASQMGGISGGFDSPTLSNAAAAAAAATTGGGITHLGVVGRGIKRAVVTPPSGAEPSPKKCLLADKAGSSVSEVTDSAAQDAETPLK